MIRFFQLLGYGDLLTDTYVVVILSVDEIWSRVALCEFEAITISNLVWTNLSLVTLYFEFGLTSSAELPIYLHQDYIRKHEKWGHFFDWFYQEWLYTGLYIGKD